jgi:hypothetical protein
MASLFQSWIEVPCHRARQQSAKSWGCGGKAPAAGHYPALSSQRTAGTLSFSIAMEPDRAAPAPQPASDFRNGAPFYNALKGFDTGELARSHSTAELLPLNQITYGENPPATFSRCSPYQ